jgi:hypothetical protein
MRFLEFFAANIRNPHTRRAYGRPVTEFRAWCDDDHVSSITAVQMANHASTRTTQLYDRWREELSLDEVERIRV